MRSRLHFAVFPSAAFLAILPLLVAGPSCGHDFNFHLLSWLEAANQMRHGGYPHWAFTPAYNAGEPRFVFYPPLSWALGALLGLVLPWKFVAIAFTWVALTLAGFTARKLVLGFAEAGAATVAGVAYLANPYMLFAAYERTAYGELLAAAWLPLLFAAALAPRVRALALAAPVALLWLTNAPAAVMGCYALLLITLARLSLRPTSVSPGSPTAWQTRGTLAWRVAAGTALGLALVSFYIVPAAYERRFVQAESATAGGMDIHENTLFHHMSPPSPETIFHDQILNQASWIVLGVLGAIVVFGWLAFRRRQLRREIVVSLSVLCGLLAFLQTPLSVAVWRVVPQLKFLQFPWRFTALLAVIMALLLGAALPVISRRAAWLGSGLLALALLVPGYLEFHQVCFPEDSVPAWVALFHSNDGVEATDEYTPNSGDSDTLKQGDPPYWSVCRDKLPADDAVALDPPAGSTPGGLPARFTITLPCPALVVLNRRQYPAWRVLVNGQTTAPYAPERDDGLLTVPMPAGFDRVEIVYITTRDRWAGLLLSLLAMLLAGLLWMRERPRRIH